MKSIILTLTLIFIFSGAQAHEAKVKKVGYYYWVIVSHDETVTKKFITKAHECVELLRTRIGETLDSIRNSEVERCMDDSVKLTGKKYTVRTQAIATSKFDAETMRDQTSYKPCSLATTKQSINACKKEGYKP